MRVISGSLKGKKLQTPQSYDVRPTTDRVKEGMFNILQFSIPGAKVLDLFSGTGQLGIEALSRGASHCDFVDQAPSSCRLVRQNISLCNLEKKASVHLCSAEKFLASSKDAYNIIMLDPPYHQEYIYKLLPLLSRCLSPNGILLAEAEHTLDLPEKINGLFFSKEYKYSKIKLIVYKNRRLANEENRRMSREF